MEFQSPYLEAIQMIPGTTPGEKFKSLNCMARNIAKRTKASGDSAAVDLSKVPEALRPLVQVEVANVLHLPDEIIEALKSEDRSVANRALKVNWFFRGDNKNSLSVDILAKRILPYASLNTRIKLIKHLAINLRRSRETKVAEDFYICLAEKYGRPQAEALLIVCSENFIWETVTKHKIILSCKAVRNLFLRYPELVIRYLKRGRRNEHGDCEDNHKIDLSDYCDFMPRLIKNHEKAFVEILEIHRYGNGIKLSKKLSETFLKNNVKTLLNKPLLYTSIMPMKVITAKLTKAQFRIMFEKVFPNKLEQFYYYNIKKYLEFYPEQERLSLIIDSYWSVYNSNFFDNHDAIIPEVLCMLPAEERARQARKKLEKEPDWRTSRSNITKTWRCYLPIDESIPSIRDEISKTSAVNDRQTLLDQMLYTCKVNNNTDALVKVLDYFTTRHKNEQIYLIYHFLDQLTTYFDLYTFGMEHWKIINDFIKFLDVKDKFTERGHTANKILAPSIYNDLVHNLPIDDKIFMMITIYIEGWFESWSVLKKYPEYDRRCFEAILSMIPLKFLGNEKWNNKFCSKISILVKSMYEFNARNAKNNKIDKLLLKDYPWLCDTLKKILKKWEGQSVTWEVFKIRDVLQANEPEMYREWFPLEEANKPLDMGTEAALKRLRKDPQHILDHWEAYLKEAKSDAVFSYGQRFLMATRWYQTIPIKFAEYCLKDIVQRTSEWQKCIIILGALFEGSAFARIIEPLLPKGLKIEIAKKSSKEDYDLLSRIPEAMNLTNPPVPLSLILPFCDGEYLNLGLISLANAGRRTSVAKIQPFTKTLVDRRVSVRKHGIRLFCLVSSMDEIKEFLIELWKTETHRSIRAIVFSKIRDIFTREPTPTTWTLMKECIDDLRNDDDDIISNLLDMKGIPDEYVGDYIRKLLEKFEKLKKNGYNEKTIIEYITRAISRISNALLPEAFTHDFLRKYFCNPLVEEEINREVINYAVFFYLRPAVPGLESRLSFLCSLYEDILKRYWDVPDPKNAMFYPINYLSHIFVDRLTTCLAFDSTDRAKVMKAILDSHLTVLKPEHDYVTYVMLTLNVALDKIVEPKQMAIKISETLPSLIQVLSPEMITQLTPAVKAVFESRVDLDKRTDAMYTFIETLCQTRNVHLCIVATILLFFGKITGSDDRYTKIIQSLHQMKHPAVLSLVYFHRNTMSSSNKRKTMG